MNKTLLLLFSLISTLSLVSAQPQIQEVEDSKGNTFNFQGENNGEGVLTYGEGTERYGRVTEQIVLENNTQFELCLRGTSSDDLDFNAWLGSTNDFHPENIGFDNTTGENCFNWKITDQHLQNNKLRFSIWSRNPDQEYLHNEGSRSDLYIGLKYENVTITQPENRATNSLIRTPIKTLINWLQSLIP